MNITAIIPTFNRKQVVHRAIDSAISQTYPVQEIIVVDDGSTDGTFEELCFRYGDRIKLIRQENAGVSAARNHGVALAEGEWIAFLDSDDVWFPRKIELQMAALEQFSGISGFCFTDNCFTGSGVDKHSFFEQCEFLPKAGGGILDKVQSRILAGVEPFFTSSVIVSRKLLIQAGGFDVAMVLREDTDLFFRLSLLTEACYVPEVMVAIDRTPDRKYGLSNLFNSRDDRKFESIKAMYEKWLKIQYVKESEFERPIQRLLCDVYYNSMENKIRQCRLRSAGAEARRLILLENGIIPVLRRLILRKIKKLVGLKA